MSVEHNEAIVEQMRRRLPGLIQDLPTWQKILQVIGGEVQEVEDAAFDLLVDSLLDNAYGALLDQYGELVNEAREGLLDPEYRQILRARIRSNRSNGAPEELIALARLMGGTDVRLFEHWPATVSVEYVHAPPLATDPGGRRADIIEDTVGGGIFTRVVEAASGYFGFEGNPNALGFGAGVFAMRVD